MLALSSCRLLVVPRGRLVFVRGGEIRQGTSNLGTWKSSKNSLELEKPEEMAGCWGCLVLADKEPEVPAKLFDREENNFQWNVTVRAVAGWTMKCNLKWCSLQSAFSSRNWKWLTKLVCFRIFPVRHKLVICICSE